MIKKSIFALALLAILAMTVHAGDLAQNPLKVDSSTISKVDPNKLQYMPKGWPSKENLTFWWPYEMCWTYKPLEICQIPIYMEVGMYAEMDACDKAKIVLKQVPCDSVTIISTGKKATEFPCYNGCTDISLRGNFTMKLGTVLYKFETSVGSGKYVIDGNKWQARYTSKYVPAQVPAGDIIPGDGAFHKTEICVDAWGADIFWQTVGTEVAVGEVAVTVKPNI